jgi:hypothetical protein
LIFRLRRRTSGSHPPEAEPARAPWRAALFAALVLTAGNACKPLVIDDPVYAAFARQIAEHPGDPYGFEFNWYDVVEPAMHFGTVPSVLPYWLAGAMTLFGDHPVAWKLSLLPFALALTGSLAFLLARFAPPFATPVLWTLALGPGVLPGLNLMIDVPAVAVGLLGFALFVRACELRRARLAWVAGLVLGLALQTKYSAAVYPALAAAHAVIHRRMREGALALCVAAAVFVGWEALLLARYGQSHFVAGTQWMSSFGALSGITEVDAEHPGTAALYWIGCLVSLFGGSSAYAGLLALVGLGGRRKAVWIAAGGAGLAYPLIAALPAPPIGTPHGFFSMVAAYHPEILLFLPLGLFAAGGVLAAAVRALDRRNPDPRADRLLLAWLGLEVASYFVIAPYPAVRRLIGLGIAASVIGARAAAHRAADSDARVGVRVATGFGLAIGALYFGSELSDAHVRHALVERVDRRLDELGAARGRETIWYTGHWEVQFYGERAGWQAAVPKRSRLRAGDWIVLPEGVFHTPLTLPPRMFRLRDEIVARSPSPWSTIPAYYDGPVPLRRQPAQQVTARICRVKGDVVLEVTPRRSPRDPAQPGPPPR